MHSPGDLCCEQQGSCSLLPYTHEDCHPTRFEQMAILCTASWVGAANFRLLWLESACEGINGHLGHLCFRPFDSNRLQNSLLCAAFCVFEHAGDQDFPTTLHLNVVYRRSEMVLRYSEALVNLDVRVKATSGSTSTAQIFVPSVCAALKQLISWSGVLSCRSRHSRS